MVIVPSLISWKSEKSKFEMNENQFKLISFEIEQSELQQHCNTFFKSFGEIEHFIFYLHLNKKLQILNWKLKIIYGISLFHYNLNLRM